MKNNRLLTIILILILTCFCVINASCTPAKKSTESPNTISASPDAGARQVTVNALRSLPSGHTMPKVSYSSPDSAKLDGWFDVNDYFSVLNHLSMRPGYTLDYIYHNIGGEDAHPFLYARKINSKPFDTLDELVKTYGDTTNWNESDHAYDYLAYVQTDDTEESFFQYTVLRIMGGQFYLWWHAAYNDHIVICDHSGLEKLFAKNGSPFSVPAEIQGKAQLLDLAPKVILDKDIATVRVVIFTSWGGFIEETYTIPRASPHTIQDVKTKTLLKWNANVTY